MILTDLHIQISTELILRAQGMNPSLVKAKSPKLIAITNQAIEIGNPLLEPRVVYERFTIQEFIQRGIKLDNGKTLEGKLIKNHFVHSQDIVVAVCTIGNMLDEFAASSFSKNPALAMALEGMGSASTEMLGNVFCNHIETLVSEQGLTINLPINPGMVGWPLEEGQPQIFQLIDPASIGVTLDPTGLMKPLKSLSMVIGLGHEVDHHTKSCDLCTLQKTCIYKPYLVN